MDPATITAIYAVVGTIGGIGMKGLWDHFRARKEDKRERMRIEVGASGDWQRALLADAQSFREGLLQEVASLRNDLRSHDQRCDDKISEEIRKFEEHCDKKMEAKIAEVRRELAQGLREISEPR